MRELRDFSDWQRWANLGVQEDLCRQMEALAELSDEAALSHRFRDIMARWRQAADVPKDQGSAGSGNGSRPSMMLSIRAARPI